jgi:hypothetical protein
METLHGFNFLKLHFDADGVLQDAPAFQELKSSGATDIIFIAHGFRNDEDDATGLYDRFLTTFRDQLNNAAFSGVASRKLVVAGVYWPSKPFQETFAGGSVQAVDPEIAQKEAVRAKLENLKATVANADQKPKLDKAIALLDQVSGSKAAQDQFVSLALSLWDNSDSDPTEGGDRIRATEGSVLLDKLKVPIIVPTGQSRGEGGTMSVGGATVGSGQTGATEGLGSLFGSVMGRIGQFLNLTTWYVMKNRAGVVGAAGVAQAVRDLKTAAPAVKIHLVGHSLGGRLMAGCAKSLAQTNSHVESLSLLEAAFSHYGFSSNNGTGQVGFFRDVIDKKVVTGPFIATYSAQDSVVGTVYAVASRLASDSVQAVGDANDPYGGIGRNGAQKTAESVSGVLHAVGTPYQFQIPKVNCLDGSGGLIKDHGDVANAFVTYAFASVVSNT